MDKIFRLYGQNFSSTLLDKIEKKIYFFQKIWSSKKSETAAAAKKPPSNHQNLRRTMCAKKHIF